MEGNRNKGREKRQNMDASYPEKPFSKEYFLSPTVLIIREAGNHANPCIMGSCSFNSDQGLRASFLIMVSAFKYI